MGRRDRRELESRLIVVMSHLLKVAVSARRAPRKLVGDDQRTAQANLPEAARYAELTS
jgi:hypothetical protein